MDINWKEVASSPGYMSMKVAVANEAKRTAKWGRKPDSRYAESFNFAINRAKHYAYNRGVTLNVILNEWEEKRDYSFINFYSDTHLPKLHCHSKKLIGIRGQIKDFKTSWHYKNDPRQQQKRILSLLIGKQKTNSNKAKPRWSMDRKRREYLRCKSIT